MKEIYSQVLKIVFFIIFCSFNASGQTQAYPIKRGETWSITPNETLPKGYKRNLHLDINEICFLINENKKIIIFLNTKDGGADTFDVKEIKLNYDTGVITYSCAFSNGFTQHMGTILHDKKEHKIILNDGSYRLSQYYY